jgi:hypothetical protein
MLESEGGRGFPTKGVWMPRNEDDVIHFTAERGFVIETLAPTIVQMMRDLDMDAHVSLPSGDVIEIEKDCTAKEIIKGYKAYMADHVSARPVSNKNEKERV